MRRYALALALCASGCGSGSPGTQDLHGDPSDGFGGSNDGGSPDDQSVPGDLAGADLAASGKARIDCGNNVVCQAPTSICCRAQPFGPGACIKPGDPCGSVQFTCDDPSDCGPNEVCCLDDTRSVCTSAVDCASRMGRRMCMATMDCDANEMCCGVGPSPDYYCSQVCPISRRDYKRDISYLDDADRKRLADELLRYKLATYRYKGDAEQSPAHLGFIIDDVEPSMSIAPDGNSVDLYGYASMAVAALQEQDRRIQKLEKEIEELRKSARRKPGR